MATRPKKQMRWPINAEGSRTTAIDLVDGGLSLLQDARNTLDAQSKKIRNRDHPVETELDNALAARDIADAMRYLSDIKRILTEAKNGID